MQVTMSNDQHDEEGKYEEQSNEKQLQMFVDACGTEGDGVMTMVDEVSNCLQLSELSSISIKGAEYFRFTDGLVHIMTEAIIQCKLSVKTLNLRNHRITDVGAIQLCQLILVSGVYIIFDLSYLSVKVYGCVLI